MIDEQLMQEITELLEYVDAKPYISYSGRSMYGAECFGLRVGSVDEVESVLTENKERWSYLTEQGMRSDSLGLSRIVYWPKVRTENWSEMDKGRVSGMSTA